MSSTSDNDIPLTLYLSLTSSPSTPRISLTLENHGTTTTSAHLRRIASDKTSIPLGSMKLIFRGRVIPDKSEGDVLKEFKLENESVIHVMGKPTANVAAAGGGGAGVTANGLSATTAAAAGSSVTLPSASNTTVNSTDASPVKSAIVKLRSSNDSPTFRTALTTADKLLGNIVSHPMEDKYRTIKKSNPAFTQRLGGIPGGSDLMSAASFKVLKKEGVEYYVLTPSADAWPDLVEAREEVGRVLTEFNNPAPPAVAGSTLPAGEMPNLFSHGTSGGMPGAGMGGGNIDALQSMLSDPNMLQNVMGMMNNPMVRNMMQNDQRFANNPMMQQSLQALQSNPEMINQFSQMMSNPNMRESMSNLMEQQRQSGGGVADGSVADPFSNGPDSMRRQMELFQQASQQHGGTSGEVRGVGSGAGEAVVRQSGTAGEITANNGNDLSGGNDSGITEEEMIAEAIARSLRES